LRVYLVASSERCIELIERSTLFDHFSPQKYSIVGLTDENQFRSAAYAGLNEFEGFSLTFCDVCVYILMIYKSRSFSGVRRYEPFIDMIPTFSGNWAGVPKYPGVIIYLFVACPVFLDLAGFLRN
jgi:hypothetical protein